MDKRFITFFVVFLAFVLGYSFLKARFFAPPENPAAPAQADPALVAKLEKNLPGRLAAGTAPIAGIPDLDEIQAAIDVAKREAEKNKAAAAVAQQPPAVADRDIVLGNDTDYKIKVILSERGAAVRKVYLNHYKAATRDDARPVDKTLLLLTDDEDGQLAGLPPDKKLDSQSFRLLVKGETIHWKVREQAVEKVVFEADLESKSVRVIKTFAVKPGQYHVEFDLRFEPLANGKGEKFAYELTGPRGIDVEGLIWKTASYRQVVIGVVDGQNSRSFTRYLRDPHVINPNGDNKPNPPNLVDPGNPRELQYAGVMTQYFACLAVVNGDPTEGRAIEEATPVYLGDDATFPAGGNKLQGRVTADLTSRPLRLEANKPIEHHYLLYAGPAKVLLLGYEDGVASGLASYYGETLHLATLADYHWDNWISRNVFAPMGFTRLLIFFTNVMHWLLESLHSLLGSYGVAIILMTVVVRGLMFPVSRKQALMGQKQQQKMAAVKPELDKIKEKFKNDPQALQQAQMDLYRKHGLLNPLNSGCLVIFLQMPIFMGLYYALYESVNLRLASFMWMQNLAAPDMLFGWGNWGNIAFIRLGPFFNILPIVSVTLMAITQKMMTPPPMDDQQAMQQKMMTFMTIFMGYMFYWVPSGLCIYFIVSSTWGMLERKLLPKKATSPALAQAGAKTSVATEKAKPSKNGTSNGVWGKLKDRWHLLLEQAKKK